MHLTHKCATMTLIKTDLIFFFGTQVSNTHTHTQTFSHSQHLVTLALGGPGL